MEFITKTIAQNHVVVFGKSYCPFCKKALKYLGMTGCNYLNIDIDLREDGQVIQNALSELTGRRTVPNVFVNGKSIGGGDDTEQLYNNGQLKKMITGL